MNDERDILREAVAAAVKARGLPRVAREADLSDMTVRSYLTGTLAGRQSLEKLQAWVSRFGDPEVREAMPEEVQKRESPPVWRGSSGLHGSGG